MKREAWTHLKLARLSRSLGISKAHAIGILEGLWQYAGRHNGRTGALDFLPSELAAWLGESEVEETRIVYALVWAGWLDYCPCHGLVVHDWSDHADEATRKQWSRGDKTPVQTCLDTVPTLSGHVPTVSGPPEPEPEPEPGKSVDRKRPTHPLPSGLWRECQKAAAEHGVTWADAPGRNQVKILRARLADGYTPDQLVRVIRGYVLKTQGMEGNLRHLTATSVYGPTKIDANLEAAGNKQVGRSAMEISKPRWNPTTSTPHGANK